MGDVVGEQCDAQRGHRRQQGHGVAPREKGDGPEQADQVQELAGDEPGSNQLPSARQVAADHEGSFGVAGPGEHPEDNDDEHGHSHRGGRDRQRHVPASSKQIETECGEGQNQTLLGKRRNRRGDQGEARTVPLSEPEGPEEKRNGHVIRTKVEQRGELDRRMQQVDHDPQHSRRAAQQLSGQQIKGDRARSHE